VVLSVTATNPDWVTLTTNSWGSSAAATNVLSTGQNTGLLVLDYDFYAIPDTLDVYYDGQLLLDSGPRSGAGHFELIYGPGISTNVIVVINQGGNSDPDTAWEYSATVSGPLYYQWFKEGVELSLATNTWFGVTNVQASDVGAYSVTITNTAGATNSQPAFITLAPAPSLRIFLKSTNTVLLSWPANCPGFVLEENPAVDDPSNWNAVTNDVQRTSGRYEVVVPATDDAGYFRLRFP